MPVVDCERNLGAARLRDDIPRPAHDLLSSAFGKYSCQRDMVDEVHIEKEFYFALAEVSFGSKESAVQRFRAGPIDEGKHLGAVAGVQGPDLQRSPVTQTFGGSVAGSVHGVWPSVRLCRSKSPDETVHCHRRAQPGRPKTKVCQ